MNAGKVNIMLDVLALLLVLAIAVWIYKDAKKLSQNTSLALLLAAVAALFPVILPFYIFFGRKRIYKG